MGEPRRNIGKVEKRIARYLSPYGRRIYKKNMHRRARQRGKREARLQLEEVERD